MKKLLIVIMPACLAASCAMPSRDSTMDGIFSDVPPISASPQSRGVFPADFPDSSRTNLLSIHLVTEAIQLHTNGHSLRPTSSQLANVRLLPEPIISDVDLRAWYLPN